MHLSQSPIVHELFIDPFGTLWRNYHDEEKVTHSHFFITFAAQKDKGDEYQGGN